MCATQSTMQTGWAGGSEESFADTLPHLVWIAAADGRLEHVNRRALEYTGQPLGELLGDGWERVIHPDDLPATRRAWADAIWAGTPYRVMYRLRRRDGRFRWHDIRGLPDRSPDDGHVLRWVGTATDVEDDRREADEARRTLALFQTFMDNTPVSAFVKDEGGRYVYANRRWEERFDPPRRGWRGKTDADFWPPETARLFRESDLRALTEDRPVERTETVTTPDGDVRHVVVLKFPVRDIGGARAVGGIVVDVTAQRRVEEQFRHAQKVHAVSLLAGGVAHDLNNLLTVVNGYGDLVVSALPEGDPHREMVAEMRRAGERAAALTRQLLTVTYKQATSPRPLNLNHVVRDTGRMLGRVLGTGVRLEAALQPQLGTVVADPGQVEQVLLNLAVNARDAMPGGGTLTIRTADGPAAAPTSAADRGRKYVLLAVSDTGTGMTPEVMGRLFEPFFTTKGEGRGTGLGLAVVRGIVADAGGLIEVDSAPGRGSTFRVYLPRADVPAEPLPGKPLSGDWAAPRGTETVLVAEDDGAVRGLVAQVLRGCGYHVLEASTGEEAAALSTDHPGRVDLLVADVVMPGPSGPVVAERLRGRHPGLRVLYLSGYGADEVARHGVSDPEEAVLSKPVTPSVLAHKVREVLDRGPGA